jgi:hypothetical protein
MTITGRLPVEQANRLIEVSGSCLFLALLIALFSLEQGCCDKAGHNTQDDGSRSAWGGIPRWPTSKDNTCGFWRTGPGISLGNPVAESSN